MRPLLIGEDNPYGSNPEFALWPSPPNSAGGRLCHIILGLDSSATYLRKFDRMNLCDVEWDLNLARGVAQRVVATRESPLILLGAKVCRAFGVPFEPFSVQYNLLADRNWYILPHPSGRSRVWNDPKSAMRAQILLKEFLA